MSVMLASKTIVAKGILHANIVSYIHYNLAFFLLGICGKTCIIHFLKLTDNIKYVSQTIPTIAFDFNGYFLSFLIKLKLLDLNFMLDSL